MSLSFTEYILKVTERSSINTMKRYRNDSINIYNTKRWEQKRTHILRRDGYLCQESKRYGKRVDANTVHHIYPVEEYPEYAWCDWNLISLSDKVHNSMHDRITGKLTALGEELKRRTIPPRSR